MFFVVNKNVTANYEYSEEVKSHSYALFITTMLMVVSPYASAAPKAQTLATFSQCRQVTLSAAFLAEEKPGQGSGFYLEVHNNSPAPIQLPDPIPISVHWYAQRGGRWLWRASSGSGGSLVNALQEHGPVFTAKLDTTPQSFHTIASGAAYSWAVFSSQNAAVRYRPGCEHCTYQGEEQFRAVVAYAVVPIQMPGSEHMLDCGLRSAPVVMPRLASSQTLRNSPR